MRLQKFSEVWFLYQIKVLDVIKKKRPGASYNCNGNPHHKVLHRPRVHIPVAGYQGFKLEMESHVVQVYGNIDYMKEHEENNQPRLYTNWSIPLQRCCRHLQSTSKNSNLGQDY